MPGALKRQSKIQHPKSKFPCPLLAVLTDRTLLTPNWALSQAVAPAVTGGANMVLYREADLPITPRTSVFRFVQDGVKGRVPLLAEGSPEWAMSVGADGAHVDQSQSIAEARAVLGPDRWLGRTVTTLDEAADSDGADYLLIHLDWTNPSAAFSVIERYAQAAPARIVPGPDVPIEHAAACLRAGASGIAIVHAAMAAYDRTGAVRQYAQALGLPVHPS